MTVIFASLFFAALYALKGGWGGTLFHWWNPLRARHRILDRLLDGKTIMAAGAFLYFLIAGQTYHGVIDGHGRYSLTGAGALWAFVLTVALMLGVAPSMGRENGAIGDRDGGWGEYISNADFGRRFGIMKGVQRGIWLFAPLAIVTGAGHMLAAGLLYVPVVFGLQEAQRHFTGKRGWAWTEPALGAILGAAIGIYAT